MEVCKLKMAAVGAGTINVNVLIRAKDQASQVVKNIASNVEQSTSRMTRAFDALKDVGKVAAGMLVRDMVQGMTRSYGEALQLGGQIDTLQSSFERLVEASGDTTLTLDRLRDATKGTVSDVELLQAANMALMLGLPTEGLDRLFNAAMKLGHAMGISTTKAVESLTIGLGRQSKLILDNLGITFEATDAYEWYAEQLGVTTKELDENQKRLAWQNYAIKLITEKAGELGDVTSEAQLAQERWNASIENAKASVGRFLGPLGMIAPALQPLMPLIGTLAGTMIPQLISAIGAKVAVLGGAKAAVIALQAAMGPLGWAIMAIVAIVAILYTAWTQNWGGIRDKVMGAIEAVQNAIGAFVNWISGAWSWLTSTLTQGWNTLWTGITTFINDPIGTIQNAVISLRDSVVSRFQEVYRKTGDKWRATWEALKTIPGLGLILRAVDGIWNSINNIMGGWPNKALEWGKRLIQGFIDGIKNMVSGVVDAVSGVADAIKNFLGLGSPAKMGPLSELDMWGPALVKTYAEGIRRTVPQLRRAVQYAAQQVSFAASPEFAPVIGEIERHHIGTAAFASTPPKVIQISGPLVYIEGSADEATAELASQLVLRELSKIVGV
jgi:phage-related protein